MTKAEQAAMRAYPPQFSSGKRYAKRVQSEMVDTHAPIRKIFLKGYEQAEKDAIERAIAWLKENANKYIVDIGVGYGEHGRNVELVVGGMCWEHLKQELEAKQ